MSVKPKKRNLMKYFKSEDFNEARMMMCAIFILLSKVNELHDDVDNKLHGYEGLFIGALKKASKDATKAFDDYEKAYRSHIRDNGEGILCDTTIDVEGAIDEAIEKNSFYLKQGWNAIVNTVDRLIDEKVRDDEEIERENEEGFELVSTKELEESLRHVQRQARNHPSYNEVKNKYDFDKGIEVGFRTAIAWINKIYLNN